MARQQQLPGGQAGAHSGGTEAVATTETVADTGATHRNHRWNLQ